MAILFFEKENANVPANVSNFCKRLQIGLKIKDLQNQKWKKKEAIFFVLSQTSNKFCKMNHKLYWGRFFLAAKI